MALSRFSFLLVPIALLAAAPPLSESYKDASSQIIAAALADQDGYAKLSYLCDRTLHPPNGLGGSGAPTPAIEGGAAEVRGVGWKRVPPPAVKVPHWMRGREDAEMV